MQLHEQLVPCNGFLDQKKVEKHCSKHLFLLCLAVSVYAEHNYGSVDFDANIGAMATCKRPTAGSYGTLTLWQRSNFSSIQTSADERERECQSLNFGRSNFGSSVKIHFGSIQTLATSATLAVFKIRQPKFRGHCR